MANLHSQRYDHSAQVTRAACPFVSAAAIDQMPDELLLDVVTYFQASDGEVMDVTTLLALSRTNKRFYRLAAQELYAKLEIYKADPYPLLRTMLTSPHLAKLVKHVVLYDKSTSSDYKRYVPDAQDKRIIEEGLRSADILHWRELAAECNKEHCELQFVCAVTTLCMPNLVSLTAYRFEKRNSDSSLLAWLSLLKHAAIQTSFDCASSLEHLQSVSITANGFSILKLPAVFWIPSLRKLRLDDLVVADEGEERGAQLLQNLVPPQCNNLEAIRFENCFIQADMLAILIASSRSLKEFWYHISLKDQRFEPRRQSELADMKLSRMLDNHTESLDTIIVINDSEEDAQSHVAMDLQEGLRKFTALKNVCCPLNMLIGPVRTTTSLAEKLPPLLYGFGVDVSRHSKDMDLLDALEQLSSVYKDYTPFLEFVWIEVKGKGPKPR
jgi:hypothetical protein